MPKQLIWFRADLRCHDNPAFWEAAQAAREAQQPLLAVFIITPQQWLAHGLGSNQVGFLLRNLAQLGQQLSQLNIPLKLLNTPDFSSLPKCLVDFCKEQEVQRVYYNQQLEWNERQRDQAVNQSLHQEGITSASFEDQVIFPPGQLRTGKGDYYTVFTPFYRKWLGQLNPQQLTTLPCPAPQPQTHLTSDPVPEQLEEFPPHPYYQQVQSLWPAGEAAALQQLDDFINQALDHYAQARDFPAQPGTSSLSPWLALGVLSARQCLAAAWQATQGRLASKDTGAGVWTSELIWREFYRHLLVGFPRVSRGRAFKPETEKLAWRSLNNPEVQQQFQAWQEGRTGFPLVDAAMRQLVATGWMHNRLRMLTAMFLSKHLLIDWREGESFFMKQLMDADLASNNGGWQWAASTGTDAVPYFRIFNPYSQSKRFDPEGDFIRHWLPELKHLNSKQIHQPPVDKADLFTESSYPQPIIDLKSARERVLQAFQAIKN
ncbi:deoxyribodipyrimidine photo-lyase [Marinospirillum celere]|uniref:Deoxyribodipyrimidine photo-lyase n=1 Tax=Marinospirillum celere TaxID=1122252 RepID=A0A1I1I0Y0_9GAMM|nr:deoxyribodipyrimidine photo-lyase [Marinospirillum celere]SFC29816.1 deoxyribodipyrimidine photo-lyase [Marinospirillum celere]